MPSPVRPITIPNPAFLGLNKQHAQVVQDPAWAITAQHAVVDAAGRLACRKGVDPLTTSGLAGPPDILQVFEYVQTDGDTFVISTTSTNIYEGTTTLTSKKGSLTITAGHWQFVNFNNKIYGWQASHTPIVWDGTSNFTTLTAVSGSLPTGNAVLAAFGRLWAVDSDKQTIKYSALLDATRWDTADGGGSIDMRTVWTKGTDEVVAISSYASSFVVFGKKHVVIWTDGSGSEIGIDPLTMYVGQIIESIGCVARDSVQLIGEIDIIFWSASGVRSLKRTLQEKATPIDDISQNIRNHLAEVGAISNYTTVKSAYSPRDGFYLLISPDADTTFCFDVRVPLENGALRVTEWPQFIATSACARVDGTLLFGIPGKIARYFGFDDAGSSYRFVYRSAWLDAGSQAQLKLAKEMAATVFAPAAEDMVFKYWTDFKSNVHSATKLLVGGALSEYNEDEYTVAEYGGDINVKNVRMPLIGASEWVTISVGIEIDIDGFPFAIQNVNVYSRIGRMN